MEQHNPMHPGAFIKRVYLEPFDIGAKQLAERLRASKSVISRILNAKGSITPTMALKLSKVIGRSPESWLAMQDNFDLWEARQKINLDDFEKLEVA
ncbi:MAG: HigA family addiction module antitoxin [Gammaproteobacteria bacterium]|nr:HigA family addiction module antitoxin [Gammaproteobacteria bacterium]